MKEMNVDFVCHTDGKGFWSSKKSDVRITKIGITTWDYEGKNDAGGIYVYFNENDWDTDSYGLIYTDKLFIKELKENLKSLGLVVENIGYSEQGMQGQYFVHLDVDPEFIKSFFKLVGSRSEVVVPPPETPEQIKERERSSRENILAQKLKNLKAAIDDVVNFLEKK